MIVWGQTLARALKSRERYKEVGLIFVFQPDLFKCSLVRDADGSINRRGFARRTVIPGLGGKCAHGRSRLAETPVNIALAGSRIGAVLQGYMAFASHSGSCEHGCGDKCSRQKFKISHLVSPLDMKSHRTWLLYGNGAAIGRLK